jgi:hypothetical protein
VLLRAFSPEVRAATAEATHKPTKTKTSLKRPALSDPRLQRLPRAVLAPAVCRILSGASDQRRQRMSRRRATRRRRARCASRASPSSGSIGNDRAVPDPSRPVSVRPSSASWTEAEPSSQKSLALRTPVASGASASRSPRRRLRPNGTSSSRGPSQSRGRRTTFLSEPPCSFSSICGPSLSTWARTPGRSVLRNRYSISLV